MLTSSYILLFDLLQVEGIWEELMIRIWSLAVDHCLHDLLVMYWLVCLSLWQQFECGTSLVILQERYLWVLLADIVIRCRLFQSWCSEGASHHALRLVRWVVAFISDWFGHWLWVLLSFRNMNRLADAMMLMALIWLNWFGVRFTLVIIIESCMIEHVVSCGFSRFVSLI